jgi:hypothetical protein
MLRHAGLLALATAAAACGAAAGDFADPAAPMVATAAVPIEAIHPGESMRFEIRLAGVLGGEAAFTTGEPVVQDGRTVIAVASRMRSAGALALVKDIRDEATTVLDLSTKTPLSTVSDVRANPRDYHSETSYRGQAATVLFTPRNAAAQQLHYDFGAQPIHDAHSAMFELRVWQAEPGARRTLWMLGGRRVWQAEMTMGPREVISTYVGNQPAIRIDGIARRAQPNLTIDAGKKPRTFSVWLSDDADRVPFRVVATTELGDVVIELVDYQRP